MSACSGCGATWTGQAAAHCGSCHRTFSGAGLFDKHRKQVGEHNRCVDPAALRTVDGEPLAYWRDGMWRGPEATPEQLAALRAINDTEEDE